MKKLRKSTFILTIILILLLSLFIVLRFTNQGLAATPTTMEHLQITPSTVGESPEDQTEKSKDRAIYDVTEWTDTENKEGRTTLRAPSAPPLRDLLPADQVDGDYVYITVTDLHSIPSLFCTAQGTPLPGFGSTTVTSGGYSTDVTDQGIRTAFLHAGNIGGATCFKNDNIVTGWETSHSHILSDTTSRTVARFGPPTIEKCTPVEAYIMAEFDKSISGTVTSVRFTEEEYKGTPPTETGSGNANTIFNRELASIARFCAIKKYEHGDMGEIPVEKDDDKKISNKDLIKWALYGMGFDIDTSKLEDSLKNNKWKEESISDVKDLKIGDILILKNSSDSDGVVVYTSSNCVFDLSSNDKILTAQPMNREIKLEDIAKVYRLDSKAKVKYKDTLATRYDLDNLRIDGVQIYEVGNPGEEKYIAKKDGKWYYVIINEDPEWSQNSEAQTAWWRKSWHAIANGSRGGQTDLGDEAQAFSDYVYTVNGIEPPDATNPSELREAAQKLEYNEDGTFKIDYKTDFEPKDPKNIKVRFNAETNKYIVGPFKADYTRAVTKAGDRPKVSFAGISRALLVGADAEGHELTNEDGTNRLKLGKNWKFVYADPAEHENNMTKIDKEDNDYPYPCPGENFYLEIDYIDDMVKLKNFKMDFHYLTAGGEYEYFEGQFLEISWVVNDETVNTRTETDEDTGTTTTYTQTQEWLTVGDATQKTGQQQSNAEGKHDVEKVDAEDGVADTPSGCPVEIEFFLEDLELRTSIMGMVWVDSLEDPKNPVSTVGHIMGIADGYDAVNRTWQEVNKDRTQNVDHPVEANSVEIIIWKVKYEKTGDTVKEIERTKAIGWKGENADKEINFIEDDGRLWVDDNGLYSVDKIQVPSAEGKEDNVIYSYDVEFVYDGQTYETTEYLKPTPEKYPEDTFTDEAVDAKLAAFKRTAEETGEPKNHKDYTKYANSSYVVENHDERHTFDSYFTEVFGEKDPSDYKKDDNKRSVLQDGKTHGYSTGGRNGTYYSGKVEDVFVESPEDNTGSLDYNGSVVEQAKVAKPKYDESGNVVKDENGNPVMEETESSEEDRKITLSKVITRDENNFILDQYRFASRTSEAGLLLPYETLYHVDEDLGHNGENPDAYNNMTFGTTNIFKPIDEYFDQINMGLLEREITDISVTKDLYTANVVVANKELKTTFNSYRELEEEMLNLNFEILPPSRTYKIDLYNADYYYRSSIYRTMTDYISRQIVSAVKQGTELRMFLTYKIQIYNSSNNTDVSINEFKDYYDGSFTLLTDDVYMDVESSVVEPYTNPDGTTNNQNRENNNKKNNKLVAEKPHFRKLKSNFTPEDVTTMYQHNWALDKESTAIADGVTGDAVFYKHERDAEGGNIEIKTGESSNQNVTGSGTPMTGDEEICSENGSYKISRCTSLRGLNSTKDGVDSKMTLKPGESFEVFVTYEVDQGSYNEIAAELQNNSNDANAGNNVNRNDNLLGSKNNIAELTRYTTIYAETNRSAHANKLRHSTVSYNIGEISGRIDQDSAPDNLDIANIKLTAKPVNNALTNGGAGNNEATDTAGNNEDTSTANQADHTQTGTDTTAAANTAGGPQYFEDDTHAAPVVKVSVKQDLQSRRIEGTVWDDGKAISETQDSKERLADGIFKAEENGDAGIPNVDTSLVEKIHITAEDYNRALGYTGTGEGTTPAQQVPANDSGSTVDLEELDYEFEFVWPNNAFTDAYGQSGESAGLKSTARVTTDKDGNYKFENFTPGNYVVRFEYGNKADITVREDGKTVDEEKAALGDFDPLKYNGQDYQNSYYQTQQTVTASGEGDSYKATATPQDTLKNPELVMTPAGTESAEGTTVVPGTKDEAGIATLNNEWLNLKEKAKHVQEGVRYSEARDYEPRRLQVIGYSRTISNENAETLGSYINSKAADKLDTKYKEMLEANREDLVANTSMVANTPKLCIEIENQADLTYGDNGVTSEQGDQQNDLKYYEIKNIDFGLALRPETKLNIQTEVNQITLSKNNGQEVVLRVYMDDEGNVISDKSGLSEETKANLTEEELAELEKSLEEKITRQRKLTEIAKDNLPVGSQGFKYVAVEATFLQGMDVNIKYKLTVFNNSDVEYVGTKVATIKNAQSIYNLATKFEAGGDYSDLDFQNSPFTTGKGIVYGKYVGLHYYTGVIAEAGTKEATAEDPSTVNLIRIKDELGKTYLPARYYEESANTNGLAKDIYSADVVATTTVDQLVDFVDNDISRLDENSTGGRVINHSWNDSSYQDLYYKLSDVSYNENKKVDAENKLNINGLTDNKDIAYIAGSASTVTKHDHDIVNGELTNVSRNNVAFSHNATMTTGPIYVEYKLMDTSAEDNTKSTTTDREAQNQEVAEQTVVDGAENKNVQEVIDISKNLTPKLADKGVVMYTVADDDATTSTFDSTNLLLTSELLPNKVFTSAKQGEGSLVSGTQTTVAKGAERFNSHVYIVTSTVASSEKINNMNYENLSEIIMYSNTVGRKDMLTIPGNANLLAKDNVANMAGYNKYVMNNVGESFRSTQQFFKDVADRGIEEKDLEAAAVTAGYNPARVGAVAGDSTAGEAIKLERDAYAARDTVTFSEPTGLSLQRQKMNQVVRIILVALTIAALAVIGITVTMVVKKTKYDDKNLIDTNKN